MKVNPEEYAQWTLFCTQSNVAQQVHQILWSSKLELLIKEWCVAHWALFEQKAWLLLFFDQSDELLNASRRSNTISNNYVRRALREAWREALLPDIEWAIQETFGMFHLIKRPAWIFCMGSKVSSFFPIRETIQVWSNEIRITSRLTMFPGSPACRWSVAISMDE